MALWSVVEIAISGTANTQTNRPFIVDATTTAEAMFKLVTQNKLTGTGGSIRSLAISSYSGEVVS